MYAKLGISINYNIIMSEADLSNRIYDTVPCAPSSENIWNMHSSFDVADFTLTGLHSLSIFVTSR